MTKKQFAIALVLCVVVVFGVLSLMGCSPDPIFASIPFGPGTVSNTLDHPARRQEQDPGRHAIRQLGSLEGLIDDDTGL